MLILEHKPMQKEIYINKIGGFNDVRFLHKMLQSSMDREARKLASNGGVTEQDRYGNLLDCVNGRDLENEEVNKQLDRLSAMHKNAEEGHKQREKESAEWSRNMGQVVRDVENKEQNRVNDFLTKHKDALDKGRETIKREQNKSYFG